ncbi:MAG: YceI family protein [Steroidobacteraceae bacterium]
MRKILLAIAISALTTSTALAVPTTYTIDDGHSYVTFAYNHMGFSIQEPRFNQVHGTVTYDGVAKIASVQVSIAANSIDIESPALIQVLQGPDYLDVSRFPEITFKSTSVKFDGDAPAVIKGILTVKGISKPVTLRVTSFKHGPNPLTNKDEVGANVTGKISRSAFGAGKYVPEVGDQLTLSIAVEALQQ